LYFTRDDLLVLLHTDALDYGIGHTCFNLNLYGISGSVFE